MARLEKAASPKAEVEFAVIGPVRELVVLASELESLKQIPQSQWKERVRTLAVEKKR